MAFFRDWSLLPQELLAEIAKKFKTHFEILLFRSVCHSWKISSALPSPHLPSFIKFPYPNIPKQPQQQEEAVTEFCSLIEYTLYALQPKLSSSSSSSSSSSKCWLMKLEEKRPNVFQLLNPLSKSKIRSLPDTTFPKSLNMLDINFKVSALCKQYCLEITNSDSGLEEEEFEAENPELVFDNKRLKGVCDFRKVVLSPTSTIENFLVMAIHFQGFLMFFRSGDKKWTVVEEQKFPFHDLIHHNGHFYAVDSVGRTFIVDSHTSNVTLVSNYFHNSGLRKRFVESKGELFLIDFFYDMGHRPIAMREILDQSLLCHETFQVLACITVWITANGEYLRDPGDETPPPPNFDRIEPIGCKVFKLDQEKRDWVQVESVGDQIFFVGDRFSFSMSASDVLPGYDGNCVLFADFCFMTDFYFLKYDEALNHDIRVFNLKDGTVDKLGKYPAYSQLFWPPPTWIAPPNSHED